MKFQIGLENGAEGRSQAWVLEHPGCFAYGPTPAAALEATGPAIKAYAAWVAAHAAAPWVDIQAVEIELVEAWEVFGVTEAYDRVARDTPDTYEVNAWFTYDWKPLTPAEIERGLNILAWSRTDLLETLAGLSPALLEQRSPSERWSIAGIARHIANAEWWYLNRLGLSFERERLPADLHERLGLVRSHLEDILPTLEGVVKVVGIDGEFWSPRKLLRRAAWHERDHVDHIRKLSGAG